MSAQLDPANEVLVANVPSQFVLLAQKLMQGVVAGPGAIPGPANEWNSVQIAPAARYLFDPLYQTGTTPAYVEFRIQTSDRAALPAGYIVVSMTQEDRPVPEFSTRGVTKTDQVLAQVAQGVVHKLVRFLPAFVAAEDTQGQLLGALGTPPFRLPTAPVTGPGSAGPVAASAALAGSVGAGRPTPSPQPAYASMKAEFQQDPGQIRSRELRVQEAAAAWRLAGGINTPPIDVSIGQTSVILPGRTFSRARLLTVQPEDIVRLTCLPAGGIQVTGAVPGRSLLRLDGADGSIDFQRINVTAPQTSGVATRDLPANVTTWIAGSGWDGDERQFSQLDELKRWCPAVGCGPTALAMLFGWWDANGLPAAFYRLNQGAGQAQQFRFNYESLRDSDAPKDTSDATANLQVIAPVYDDLHDLSNTFCWHPSGEGSTRPEDLEGAFDQYVARIRDPQPWPQNEYGDQFVAGVRVSDFNTPGVLSDWDGGGKPVARGIQHGYPGIIGSYVGDHTVFSAHYPLAFGYQIVELEEGGNYAMIGQYFVCNMGWGPGQAPQSYHCEEVWGGLTVSFSKRSTPMSPDDGIAATFAATTPDRVDVFTRQHDRMIQHSAASNPEQSGWPAAFALLPDGTFRSGPAACVSANGLGLHLVGRGDDDRFWRAFSSNGGASWDMAWSPIGDGTFTSMPAIAVSGDGMALHVFGRGQDNHIWRAHSPDGGASWDVAWAPIDQSGVFSSGPAAAVSRDGAHLHVIARGNDMRYWRAYSSSQGVSWDLAWAPIGDGVFRSNPAIAVSADGLQLNVVGRGNDDRFWRAHSPDGGATWDVAWAPMGEGTFVSSPAVAVSPDGKIIHVFGVGLDRKVWRALSLDGGASWPVLWSQIAAGDDSNVF